jgi:small conductance mechanosensitive channel
MHDIEVTMVMVLDNRLLGFTAWFEQNGWHTAEKLGGVVLTCVVFLWAMRLLSRAVNRSLGAALKEGKPEAMRRAKTLGSVLENCARVMVVSFFLLELLQEMNVNVGPLIAGLGLAGAALGFGAQSLVKDVIGGFFMLVEDQFSVGDIVALGDKHIGVVERMTLRVTVLRDLEGKAHYVPNGSFSDVVVLSKEFGKAMVDVEASLDEDLDRVMEVLREVGAELARDLPTVLEPTEVIGIESMTAVGCVIRTLTKTAPGQHGNVAREYRRRIVQRFKLEGFARPLAQHVIWTK